MIIILKVIVCLCRGVSSRKILNVIENGATSVNEVTAQCGAGGDCGACRATIQGMIETAQREDEGTCASTCASKPAPVDAAA